jgi:hypothetical protein
VVLPVDGRVNERSDGAHVPYLEFDVLDEPHTTGRFAQDTMYPRDLLVYRRVHLSADRITIRNTVAPAHGKLNVLQSFEDRVPSLTALTPGLPQEVDPPLLDDAPPANRVAAYFDIPYGDLHTGPPNLIFTRFDREERRIPARRLPSWIELQIPIRDGEGPIIDVESFLPDGPARPRTITLARNTDRITIGNQLEADIERNTYDPGNLRSEDFRAHFQMYYDLIPNASVRPTLPSTTAAAGGGCAGIRYP